MADKGIRVNVNNKFKELLPQRATIGNKRFRAEVIGYAMEEFGISLASAATAYNNAFIAAREIAKTDEAMALALLGLGRAEDKKGGRKPKVKAVADVNDAGETAPVQTVFNVLTKKDGTVVAEGVSFEAAQEMVAKAKAAKKSALYWV